MTLQLDSALSSLARGARSRTTDTHTERRLQDVQGFLEDELRAVEANLQACLREGVEPGLSAARHLLDGGGKRVRPLSLLLAARCFGAEQPELVDMAAVVELVHSATLLHDDVIDEGLERRGSPTSARIHGNAVSVLGGDLLLVTSLERTAQVAPALLPALISTLRRLVEGEIIQLRGRTDLDLSEETYARVLSDKTASLFSFATRSGATMAGASQIQIDALGRFGECLGFAFQLVDDVLDYTGETTGKAMFADLLEGKLTLPLVLALKADPSLEALVQQIHRGDSGPVAEVSRRIIASGACDETRARAKTYTQTAVSALASVPACSARSLLEVVALELSRRVS